MKRTIFSSVALSLWIATPAIAQFNNGDMQTLKSFSIERCLAPMSAGEEPDFDGLREIGYEWQGAYGSDNSTLDDRIYLRRYDQRGLRSCDTNNNVNTAPMDNGTEKRVRAWLDGLANDLVASGQYVEDGPCDPIEGSWGRILIANEEARPGTFLRLVLSSTSRFANGGISVSEHYGQPATRCTGSLQ